MRETWNEERYNMNRRYYFMRYEGQRFWKTPPIQLSESESLFLSIFWDMYQARR